MSPEVGEIRFTRLDETDFDWVWHVYCMTTRNQVELVVDWPESEHRRIRRRALRRGGMEAIWVPSGERVGLVDIAQEDEDLSIRHLEVLPDLQGRGVGTLVVQAVIERAAATGRGVTLRVQHTNPRAHALYRRLGFVVTESHQDVVSMRHPPERRRI